MNKKATYQDYLNGTQRILKNSQKEKTSYTVKILKKEFIVLPKVFSPKYFNDTEFFARHLPIRKNETVLEVGPGTGILSIIAINKGAKKVLAIDINPQAIKNTLQNIKRYNLKNKIEVRKGNIYSSVKKREKFDVIFWNTPFGLTKKEKLTNLEKSVFDTKYTATKKFITDAPKYLSSDGRLLIGFSSTLGKLNLIKKFSKKAGFNLKLIFSTKSKEIYPVKFEIFEGKQKR